MPKAIAEKILKTFKEPAAVSDKSGILVSRNRAFDEIFPKTGDSPSSDIGKKLSLVVKALKKSHGKDLPEKGIKISHQNKEYRINVYLLTNTATPEECFLIIASSAPDNKSRGKPGIQRRNKLKLAPEFSALVGEDPEFVNALFLAQKGAKTNLPILLMGESGTGKEVLARTVHMASKRKSKAFVDVNCAAIPDSLVESELFGYEKGAFTGANPGGQHGYFETAHGGSIFMDEIGDAAPTTQAKLLRVLQDGQFKRVGGNRNIAVDVRLISATNQELKKRIDEGRFRKDLFYRINTITIKLPPLRKRRNDLPLLVEHFLAKKAGEASGPLHFSREAMAILLAYPWPGNVRELKGVVDYAVTMAADNLITPDSLPGYVLPDAALPVFREAADGEEFVSEVNTDALGPILQSVERAHIKRIMDESESRSEAIRRLGISRRTFYIKMKQYSLG